uniref:Rabenosyn-5 n=1 Tax=Schistocephalus solidus TaxID=70667 RepID=A0A0X3P3L6_SCHSO
MTSEGCNVEEAIIEGFICPSCLNSYGRADLLEEHFRTQHIRPAYIKRDHDLQPFKRAAVGLVRDRTAEFFRFRRIHVDNTALETNLLLIRLQKLTAIRETVDSAQRLGKCLSTHLISQPRNKLSSPGLKPTSICARVAGRPLVLAGQLMRPTALLRSRASVAHRPCVRG